MHFSSSRAQPHFFNSSVPIPFYSVRVVLLPSFIMSSSFMSSRRCEYFFPFISLPRFRPLARRRVPAAARCSGYSVYGVVCALSTTYVFSPFLFISVFRSFLMCTSFCMYIYFEMSYTIYIYARVRATLTRKLLVVILFLKPLLFIHILLRFLSFIFHKYNTSNWQT